MVDIVTGSQFGCAITTDGILHCWGNSSQGKLGNGETGGTQPLPQPVKNPTDTGPLTDVTEVSAGSGHACAVSAGTAHCWGGNFGGKLGNGESSPPEPIPVEVRNPEDTGHSKMSAVCPLVRTIPAPDRVATLSVGVATLRES